MEIRTLQYFPGRRQGTEYDRCGEYVAHHTADVVPADGQSGAGIGQKALRHLP